MNRRVFVQWTAAIILLPHFVLAQAQKRFRVAILWATNEAAVKVQAAAFLGGLSDLG